jgi:hypothetical protein
VEAVVAESEDSARKWILARGKTLREFQGFFRFLVLGVKKFDSEK